MVPNEQINIVAQDNNHISQGNLVCPSIFARIKGFMEHWVQHLW